MYLKPSLCLLPKTETETAFVMRTRTCDRESRVQVAGHRGSRISGYWMTEDRRQKMGGEDKGG